MQSYFLETPIIGDTSIDFYSLMGAVATLVEHERRLQAMITLQASEGDVELVALRLLLGKLVEDTCVLVSIYPSMRMKSIQTCTSNTI